MTAETDYAVLLAELEVDLAAPARPSAPPPGPAAEVSSPSAAPDAEALRLFAQIGPHWGDAYALLRHLEQLNAQVAQGDRRGRALFLLDAGFRWIGGNEAADRMVAAGWWRGRRGRRLDSDSAVTRAAWQGAQRQPPRPEAPRSRAIPVYDALASLVAFASLRRCRAAAAVDERPEFALLVRPLQSGDDEELGEQLRHVFDLTQAEASLASALRRHGDLAQAAAALGITDGSARTRLQAVFEKTAIHRQSELLRMLDALADTIA